MMLKSFALAVLSALAAAQTNDFPVAGSIDNEDGT